MQKAYAMNIFILPHVTSHLIFIPLQTQKTFLHYELHKSLILFDISSFGSF